jgi:hypothetical protein
MSSEMVQGDPHRFMADSPVLLIALRRLPCRVSDVVFSCVSDG